MRLASLTLVTGNEGKRRESERIVGRSLKVVAIELPEIQSLDLREVVWAKAREAWRRLGRPVVVEETGLELLALNGFPGPLVKWMLQAVGPEGIARTGFALGDPRARARCALLAYDDGQEMLAEGVTEGALADPPRGDRGFGWDPAFQPEGQDLTYAELADDVKDRIGHRGRAWRALLERLED